MKLLERKYTSYLYMCLYGDKPIYISKNPAV